KPDDDQPGDRLDARKRLFAVALDARLERARLVVLQAVIVHMSLERATSPRRSRSSRCASTERPAAGHSNSLTPLYIRGTIEATSCGASPSSFRICRSRWRRWPIIPRTSCRGLPTEGPWAG